MPIYPYVYKLTHKTTGEFYIGFRCANKVPAEQDLGVHYFTSSKCVKPKFHEFDYIIIAEFFDKDAAYDFEQLLIFEQWDNPALLNLHHQYNSNKFIFHKHSDVTKQKMKDHHWSKTGSYSQIGRKLSANAKQKIGAKAKTRLKNKSNHPGFGKPSKLKGIPRNPDHIKKWADKLAGVPKSESHKMKLKEIAKNRARVCRLSDRKEMDVANFGRWCKRQDPDMNLFQSSNVRIS